MPCIKLSLYREVISYASFLARCFFISRSIFSISMSFCADFYAPSIYRFSLSFSWSSVSKSLENHVNIRCIEGGKSSGRGGFPNAEEALAGLLPDQ